MHQLTGNIWQRPVANWITKTTWWWSWPAVVWELMHTVSRQLLWPCATQWCAPLWSCSAHTDLVCAQGFVVIASRRSYSIKAGGVMWLFVLSVCYSASMITHEHRNGRPPNLIGIGKRWPYRLLVLIKIHVWILYHFSIFLGTGHLRRFLTFAHTVTCRYLRNLAKWLTPTRQWIHKIWERSGRHLDPDQN